MANSCGRAARGDDVEGSDLQFCVRCYLWVSKELKVWMRTGQVRRRMTFWHGYTIMVAVGRRPKQFMVENRV